jgi:hypothetical protein
LRRNSRSYREKLRRTRIRKIEVSLQKRYLRVKALKKDLQMLLRRSH